MKKILRTNDSITLKIINGNFNQYKDKPGNSWMRHITSKQIKERIIKEAEAYLINDYWCLNGGREEKLIEEKKIEFKLSIEDYTYIDKECEHHHPVDGGFTFTSMSVDVVAKLNGVHESGVIEAVDFTITLDFKELMRALVFWKIKVHKIKDVE